MTRHIRLIFSKYYRGNVSYAINEGMLFNQLSFYLSLVDFKLVLLNNNGFIKYLLLLT